jgi:hypothetical protein
MRCAWYQYEKRCSESVLCQLEYRNKILRMEKVAEADDGHL